MSEAAVFMPDTYVEWTEHRSAEVARRQQGVHVCLTVAFDFHIDAVQQQGIQIFPYKDIHGVIRSDDLGDVREWALPLVQFIGPSH